MMWHRRNSLQFDPAVNRREPGGRSLSRLQFSVLLIILAFALRLAAVLALRDIHQFHGPGPAGADAVEFNALGLNLAAGHGYELAPGHPTAFRAPGFPFLLAAVYLFAPANYALVYLLLCAIGTATCLITWLAAREIVNERVARVSGILLALYFSHIYQSTLFLSEALFGLCTMSAVWMYLIYARTRNIRFLVACGLLFGYDALTRPVSIIMAIFLMLAFIWTFRKQPLRKVVAPFLCFGMAAALMVVPWTWRNFTVFHRIVLIATNGGSTFYGSNNDIVLKDRKYQGFWISTVSLPGRREIEATPDEVSHDQLEWSLGKQWVLGHLRDMPRLTVYKLVRFVIPNVGSNNRKFVLIQAICYLPYLALMFIGAVACSPRIWKQSGWLVMHSLVAANILNVVIFCGDPRYRDAIAPILVIYAAAGLGFFRGWFRTSPAVNAPAPRAAAGMRGHSAMWTNEE